MAAGTSGCSARRHHHPRLGSPPQTLKAAPTFASAAPAFPMLGQASGHRHRGHRQAPFASSTGISAKHLARSTDPVRAIRFPRPLSAPTVRARAARPLSCMAHEGKTFLFGRALGRRPRQSPSMFRQEHKMNKSRFKGAGGEFFLEGERRTKQRLIARIAYRCD